MPSQQGNKILIFPHKRSSITIGITRQSPTFKTSRNAVKVNFSKTLRDEQQKPILEMKERRQVSSIKMLFLDDYRSIRIYFKYYTPQSLLKILEMF